MEPKITVAGIGPGHPDYIVPAAQRAIEQAEVLVGSKRALDTFARSHQDTYVIGGDITAVTRFIEKTYKSKKLVVLVSGDPGYYSMLAALRQKFDQQSLMVIPGISSVQMAFARLADVWQDATIGSLHGRDADESLLTFRKGKKLGLLTDGKHTPSTIAKMLLARQWPPDAAVWLCSNLSYESEVIKQCTLGDCTEVGGFEHCVLVVKG